MSNPPLYTKDRITLHKILFATISSMEWRLTLLAQIQISRMNITISFLALQIPHYPASDLSIFILPFCLSLQSVTLLQQAKYPIISFLLCSGKQMTGLFLQSKCYVCSRFVYKRLVLFNMNRAQDVFDFYVDFTILALTFGATDVGCDSLVYHLVVPVGTVPLQYPQYLSCICPLSLDPLMEFPAWKPSPQEIHHMNLWTCDL